LEGAAGGTAHGKCHDTAILTQLHRVDASLSTAPAWFEAFGAQPSAQQA